MLHATWASGRARHFRRAGGPWDPNATLDSLPFAGAVVEGSNRLSPEAADEVVSRVAGALHAAGARRGRAVTWRLSNGLASAVLFRACWRIGAVAAPVLHSLGPADTAGALGQVDPAMSVDLDVGATLEDLLARYDASPIQRGAVPVRPSDIAVVLFTSGSTGTPKAVLHAHRGLLHKARLMAQVHGLGARDAVLMPAPMAHVSGLLNGLLLPGAAGMTSVLIRRFDAEEAVASLARERITFLAGPPTFFIAMSEFLRGPNQVRLISTGGASVSPAFVLSTAETFGCRVKRTYGSTEAPTVTTSMTSDPVEIASETDGRAVGEVELRLDAAGELWVRGPELFCGYADQAATDATVGPGGWFRTGDLGTIDSGGWLRIVGRLKDVIIRGGENISASEVENVLERHPNVRQAVAVGCPDALMGERVCAFIVASGPFDLEECGRWFGEQGVARFKTPERVELLSELPLLGSGKPDRAALRKAALPA